MISFAQSRPCTASVLVSLALPAAVMAQPTVSNVQFTQQATPTGTEVIITYDLASPNRPANITLGLSKNGGLDNYVFPITSATGDLANVSAGTGKSITWAIATDYPNEAIPNARIRVTADDGCPEAKNDFVSTDDNTVLNGNVFANNGAGPDVDTGGGALTVVALNSNGALVGVPTVLASGATLTLNANGTFSYDPSPATDALQVGQQAFDSFTYTLTDGTPTCPSVATVNVTINGANDAPVVAGESYDTVGNTTLQVAATKTINGSVFVVGNLLTNDSDVDGPNALRTVLQSVNSVTGNVNLDGTFAMTPLAGTPGPCSFTYRVEDGLTSTNGTVTITQVGRIWYVQNNAAPGGTGRSTDPFDTLIEAQDNSVAGETIYVHTGDGTTTGQNAGITVKANQRLIGEGSPLGAPGTVNGVANPQLRAAGSPPLLGSATGNAVTVILDNTIRGFNIADRPNGAAIRGSNFGTLTADTISINGTGNIFNLSSGTINGSFPTASSSSGGSAVAISAVNGSIDIDGGTISGSVTAPISIGGGNLNFTYSGSVSQSNDAPLVSISGGHTGTLQFDTGTLSATNGTGLQFNNSDGTYNFSGVTTLNGGDAGIDIINGSSGNFSFNNAPITNPSGVAFNVDGGAGSIGHAGTITKNNAGRLVSIQNRIAGSPSSVTLTGNLSSTGAGALGILVNGCTGGTVTFSGSSKTLNTGANQAVTLTGNAGTTIDFTGGGLDIDTTSATGFGASGGATGISVQGTGNTIDSTTGSALNVASTTISSNGLTFQRISANGGSVPGIFLNSTGSAGGLTVTGEGGGTNNGSGGTISNLTGDFAEPAVNTHEGVAAGITGTNGIYLKDTSKVSLAYMNITGNNASGIFGHTLNGFQMNRCVVSNNGDATASIPPDEMGVQLYQVTGTASGGSNPTGITNCTISNNKEFELLVGNSTGTLTDFRLVNSNVSSNNNNTLDGHGNLVSFLALGNATMTLTTVGGTFTGNAVPNGTTATGIHADHSGSGGTMTANVSGASFTNNNVAVSVSNALGGNLVFDIDGNTATGQRSHGLNFFAAANSTGSVLGKFRNNVVGTNGVAGSATQIGIGIRVQNEGACNATLLISGNTVQETAATTSFQGINVNVGIGGSPTAGGTTNLTITNNIIRNILNSRGIVIQDNQTTGPAFPTIFANVSGNQFQGTIAGQVGNGEFMRIRELNGTTRVTQAAPTGSAIPSELDDANGFNDVSKINISGGVAFSQGTPPTPP